jgi:hypothetical protein
MDRLSERERELEIKLEQLTRRHPLYPRAWKAEVERRAAWPAWDELDAVESLIEERGFRSPGPATILTMIEDEKRYLTAFEPDELLPEPVKVPARSSAD